MSLFPFFLYHLLYLLKEEILIMNVTIQLKSHVKNKNPDNFDELKNVINKVIKKKIKEEHLKNYFKYLFIQANDYINNLVFDFSVKKV